MADYHKQAGGEIAKENLIRSGRKNAYRPGNTAPSAFSLSVSNLAALPSNTPPIILWTLKIADREAVLEPTLGIRRSSTDKSPIDLVE